MYNKNTIKEQFIKGIGKRQNVNVCYGYKKDCTHQNSHTTYNKMTKVLASLFLLQMNVICQEDSVSQISICNRGREKIDRERLEEDGNVIHCVFSERRECLALKRSCNEVKRGRKQPYQSTQGDEKGHRLKEAERKGQTSATRNRKTLKKEACKFTHTQKEMSLRTHGANRERKYGMQRNYRDHVTHSQVMVNNFSFQDFS